MNPDAYHVSLRNLLRLDALQGLIYDDRIAEFARRRSTEYVQPAWCDDADAEGPVTWIDEINFQRDSSEAVLLPLAIVIIS